LRISNPERHRGGAGRALGFTENYSTGRITTAGLVTSCTGNGINASYQNLLSSVAVDCQTLSLVWSRKGR